MEIFPLQILEMAGIGAFFYNIFSLALFNTEILQNISNCFDVVEIPYKKIYQNVAYVHKIFDCITPSTMGKASKKRERIQKFIKKGLVSTKRADEQNIENLQWPTKNWLIKFQDKTGECCSSQVIVIFEKIPQYSISTNVFYQRQSVIFLHITKCYLSWQFIYTSVGSAEWLKRYVDIKIVRSMYLYQSRKDWCVKL